ncbi:MAG TPA: S9 family peptidase [Vicinamibacterales bacterium]|jgi:dipeptidyl-peptidase-4|nr:S9 family peptidase [Vicinamibacterales bacterium]
MTFARRCLACALVFAVSAFGASAAAQQKALTLDAIYDPPSHADFNGTPASGFEWIDGGRYAWPRRISADEVEWTSVDAATGRSAPLFDTAKFEAAVGALPGVGRDEARRQAHSQSLTFNRQHTAALMAIGGDLYAYSFDRDRAVRLTSTPGEEDVPAFSPDGALVAFVRDHDLFVVDVEHQRESRLTTDGGPAVYNGRLDWVYEEEIYGRGHETGFWWSPDSTRIAYLRLDDSAVPVFPVVDHIPYGQEVETTRYPKVGDPNPSATLGVVRVAGGATQWVDFSKYPAPDRLVVSVSWSPDSRTVWCQVQNRTQTWLDVNAATPGGPTKTMFRESTKAWIQPNNPGGPQWQKDGSFLWLSEATGWTHLFHYGADGGLLGQVTAGRWEVRTLYGAGADGWIYFAATEHSPIGVDVYRIRADGTGLQRLSARDGTHAAVFSPGFTFYVDSWSDATTPEQVRLHKADGTEVRTIDENRVPALGEYRLSTPEFVHVPTRDGFVMEAEMIKPPGFDPSRRYPVYQFTYGGPQAPQVKNAWGGTVYLYRQLLASRGIIVWICDNRSASGKGAESAWPIYRHLGESELADIEDAVAWLKRQPYVDGSRIGLHGWSYGGYLTSYVLTHSTSFAMGIAGGTVADWRDYDSVYTERYMGLASDNADGYRRSSPRWSAGNLKAPLLLIHGAIDDNVHVANTLQFAYELQQAGRPFELMLYPKSRHGIADPALVKHLRQLMFDFTIAHLQP